MPLLYRYFITYLHSYSREIAGGVLCLMTYFTQVPMSFYFVMLCQWLCATPTPGTSTSGWMDFGVPRSVHQYQCLQSREPRVLERQQSSRMFTSRHKGDRGVAPVPLPWESVGQSHQLERIEKMYGVVCRLRYICVVPVIRGAP